MPYSAVTQPRPVLRRNGGTRSSTVAAQSTWVSPKRARQEPSAYFAAPSSSATGRIASAARPEGRIPFSASGKPAGYHLSDESATAQSGRLSLAPAPADAAPPATAPMPAADWPAASRAAAAAARAGARGAQPRPPASGQYSRSCTGGGAPASATDRRRRRRRRSGRSPTLRAAAPGRDTPPSAASSAGAAARAPRTRSTRDHGRERAGPHAPRGRRPSAPGVPLATLQQPCPPPCCRSPTAPAPTGSAGHGPKTGRPLHHALHGPPPHGPVGRITSRVDLIRPRVAGEVARTASR